MSKDSCQATKLLELKVDMPGSHSGMSRRWVIFLVRTLVQGPVCILAPFLMENVRVGGDPEGQESLLSDVCLDEPVVARSGCQ